MASRDARKQLVRMSTLAHIEEMLMRRREKRPDGEHVLVLLDLDETVFESTLPAVCAPTASRAAIQVFLDMIFALPDHSLEARKNAASRFTWLLQNKRTVEPITRALLGRLHSSPHIKLLGLTARRPRHADYTQRDLGSLGIAMHQHNDWNTWVDPAETGTGAVCHQGVIHTNASQKGPVLRRFLEHSVLGQAEMVPHLIVMVDNIEHNCQSVYDSLDETIQEHQFDLIACHYQVAGARPPQAEDEDEQGNTKVALDHSLLARHLTFFLDQGFLVDDSQLPPVGINKLLAACAKLFSF